MVLWACCEKRQLSEKGHYTRMFKVGEQRRRWVEDITEWLQLNISEVVGIPEDRHNGKMFHALTANQPPGEQRQRRRILVK